MKTPPLSELLSRMAPPDGVIAPNFTVIQRTINKVLDDHGRPKKRNRDTDRLLSDIRRRIEQNDWNALPLSYAMEAAELAFSAEFRSRDDLAVVRNFYIDEIPASDRPGFLGAMTRIYIETFEEASSHTLALAQALKNVVSRIGAQWRKVLETVPDLFDPSKVVGQIADLMAGLDNIWAGLREIGFRQPHAPGLMGHAHLAFLKLVGARLTTRIEIERVLNWLKPEGHAPLSTGAAETVAALLRPWKDQGIPNDLKAFLMDRLLDLYGHPKVSRNAVWNLVPDDLENLFLHWLTGADIRMLFRVLTEVERGHMWADRENFWWGLYEKNRIDEVWVAFNPEGFRAAQSKLPRDQRHGQGQMRFAIQEGDRDKSLLVMRIGNKIVVEGTYNFKVHIFSASATNAPKLYQRKYDVADIRSRGRTGANTIPHLGYWQGKVLKGLTS
jgi:hypothetical protein